MPNELDAERRAGKLGDEGFVSIPRYVEGWKKGLDLDSPRTRVQTLNGTWRPAGVRDATLTYLEVTDAPIRRIVSVAYDPATNEWKKVFSSASPRETSTRPATPIMLRPDTALFLEGDPADARARRWRPRPARMKPFTIVGAGSGPDFSSLEKALDDCEISGAATVRVERSGALMAAFRCAQGNATQLIRWDEKTGASLYGPRFPTVGEGEALEIFGSHPTVTVGSRYQGASTLYVTGKDLQTRSFALPKHRPYPRELVPVEGGYLTVLSRDVSPSLHDLVFLGSGKVEVRGAADDLAAHDEELLTLTISSTYTVRSSKDGKTWRDVALPLVPHVQAYGVLGEFLHVSDRLFLVVGSSKDATLLEHTLAPRREVVCSP